MRTVCDAGCQKAFTVQDFQHVLIENGIEKTFFACPHCLHEYVAYYSDSEVKKLQQKMRNIQQRFKNPRADHKAAAKMEEKTRLKIKARMDELRQLIEGPHQK